MHKVIAFYYRIFCVVSYGIDFTLKILLFENNFYKVDSSIRFKNSILRDSQSDIQLFFKKFNHNSA